MSIDVICAGCQRPLTEPGALFFGPPEDEDGHVVKSHICIGCYVILLDALDDIYIESAAPESGGTS